MSSQVSKFTQDYTKVVALAVEAELHLHKDAATRSFFAEEVIDNYSLVSPLTNKEWKKLHTQLSFYLNTVSND